MDTCTGIVSNTAIFNTMGTGQYDMGIATTIQYKSDMEPYIKYWGNIG